MRVLTSRNEDDLQHLQEVSEVIRDAAVRSEELGGGLKGFAERTGRLEALVDNLCRAVAGTMNSVFHNQVVSGWESDDEIRLPVTVTISETDIQFEVHTRDGWVDITELLFEMTDPTVHEQWEHIVKTYDAEVAK